jgi:hypothetical protein
MEASEALIAEIDRLLGHEDQALEQEM